MKTIETKELNRLLIEAIKQGDLEEVKRLVKEGADVNAKDCFKYTTLILACCYKYFEIAHFLIDNGADINAY
jgi:ankyrin repeat protein